VVAIVDQSNLQPQQSTFNTPREAKLDVSFKDEGVLIVLVASWVLKGLQDA